MKVLIGEHHPSRGRHLKYRGNEKPGLFLDLIKSLMTARSKASRNFATRRVGMERVEDRFPYARGCMIDSWIIPNTRIQNSGLMYMVNWKKPEREHYIITAKTQQHLISVSKMEMQLCPNWELNSRPAKLTFLAMGNQRTLSTLSSQEVEQHLIRMG